MSVAELAPRGDDFERMPPHDVAAEQCVLGGMLLSKDAISDVIEVIRPADHYRPAHQLIHEAILDLYSRGEPADAITVANELTRRAEITTRPSPSQTARCPVSGRRRWWSGSPAKTAGLSVRLSPSN